MQRGVCRLIKVLTADVSLLVASIQTIIVAVTLPHAPYAALIVALELIASAPLWLQTAAGSFYEKTGDSVTYVFSTNYWHHFNSRLIKLIMSHDPQKTDWDLTLISEGPLGSFVY